MNRLTKLQQLIKELCPNGVEYKTVQESVGVNRGKRLTKSQLSDTGKYEVYHGSKDSILGKYTQSNAPANTTIIVNTGGIGGVKFLKDPFWCSDGSFWLGQSDSVNSKYLYYCLSGYEDYFYERKRVGGVPTIDKSVIADFKIPIPPLPVQEEIVRILDELTEKTDELISELKAELEARKKQYEHYKNKLMSVDSANIFKLGDIAFICDGTHQTPHYTDSGVKFISVENINDIFNTTKYISKVDYDKYKVKPQIGDVFMTRIGSIGKCAVLDKQEDLAYYVTLALIRPNQNIVISKYLKYLIESMVGTKELRKRILLNAVPIKINKDDIGKIELPIPSINSQEKIVAQIEKYDIEFDMLIRSILNEIENRKKQYEYYRDKLLTF